MHIGAQAAMSRRYRRDAPIARPLPALTHERYRARRRFDRSYHRHPLCIESRITAPSLMRQRIIIIAARFRIMMRD